MRYNTQASSARVMPRLGSKRHVTRPFQSFIPVMAPLEIALSSQPSELNQWYGLTSANGSAKFMSTRPTMPLTAPSDVFCHRW